MADQYSQRPSIETTLQLFDGTDPPTVRSDGFSEGGNLLLTVEFDSWYARLTLVGSPSELERFLRQLLDAVEHARHEHVPFDPPEGE